MDQKQGGSEDGFQNAAAAAEHLATLRKQREDIESEIEGLAPFAPLELALFLDGVAWTAKRDGAIRVVNHEGQIRPTSGAQDASRGIASTALIDFWAGRRGQIRGGAGAHGGAQCTHRAD